jgi:multiple sugar transport system ATP-binding protein
MRAIYFELVEMARVDLKNVCKVYPGGVNAVNNVTLDVSDSEFVVLVGPSGCGKTTTLRMIAGLEEISSGSVSIGDRVVNDVHPKDRDIAMVFQNYALYPHMSVYENMAFGLKVRKFSKTEINERVTETAKVLGIDQLLDRKPKQLSGGQRQRVAVGRAIVRHPKAFLFDEPLSNLDAKMRVETRAELKKLHRRLATTTIYVTHDQEEAMTLGDRVVVMKDGEVQQADRPLTIYDRPVNRFVAGFMGIPPMNFISGRIVYEKDNIQFDDGIHRICLPEKWRDRLSGYAQKSVVLGIRPENFVPVAGETKSSEPGDRMNVRIDLVEPLGDKMDVYMTSGNQTRLIGRLDSHVDLKEGQEVQMRIDTNKLHIFENGECGMNITLEQHQGA